MRSAVGYALIMFLPSACKDGGPDPIQLPVPVGIMWVSGASGAFVQDTFLLAAFYRDSNGDPIGLPRPTVTWSSSNPALVAILSESLAVALDTGTVVLTATTAGTPIDTLHLDFTVIAPWTGRLVWIRSPDDGGQPRVAVQDLPSHTMRQLPDFGFPGSGTGTPTVTRDGRYVAAISTRPSSLISPLTIFIHDFVTGLETAPLANANGDHFCPVWFPGDTLLAFLTATTTGYDVFTIRPDGSGTQRRTDLRQAAPPFFDVTPDDHLILELRVGFNPSGNHPTDLFEVTLAGDTVRRLTSDPGYETNVKVSSDGTMIAYESEGRVWIRDRDGSNPRQLVPAFTTVAGFGPAFTKYHAGSQHPSWTIDGQFVLIHWDIDPYLDAERGLYEVRGDLYAIRLADGLAIRLTRSVAFDGQASFR